MFSWKRDYSTVCRSTFPGLFPHQLLGLTTHVVQHSAELWTCFEISSLQIRNANYVLSRWRVNKILKQHCLLRLSLQVPDGDYGTVQIRVWREIGALLNYGSHGRPLGMQRIDRGGNPRMLRAPRGRRETRRDRKRSEKKKICGGKS